MTDREQLIGEIEQAKKDCAGRLVEFAPSTCDRIIAALRRGPEPSTRMAVEDAIDKSKLPGTWEKLSRPPSGEMVMVPREPTKNIITAICEEAFPQEWLSDTGVAAGYAAVVYRAMLSAAEAEGRKS